MQDKIVVIPVSSANELELLIPKNDILFVDFWASWCAPCKQFGVVYESVAKKHPEVSFAKFNIEQDSEFAEALNIRSIPHLVVFKKGIVIYSEAGSMPESALTELVQQAVDADVSKIWEEIEKNKN